MTDLAAKRATSILQFVGIAILVLLFLVTVMTAVAQQQVLARMEERELRLGYSPAFAMVRGLEEKQKELADLKAEERKLLREHGLAASAFRRAKVNANAAWQSFLPISQSLQKRGLCEGAAPGDDLGSRLTRWNEVKECLASGTLNPGIVRTAEQVMSGRGNFEARVQPLGEADDRFTTLNEERVLLAEKIKAAAVSDQEMSAKESFAEMAVLKEFWMLGGGFLAPFPPPMLQILLAFVSGGFGALLITLVLIVYPNNELNLEKGKESWTRILLGGLIAMCVYIVLLGGSSVLGTSGVVANEGTNYMAFCAIGILAGMFSDRVAYWLSDKADAFFKRTPNQQQPREPVNG